MSRLFFLFVSRVYDYQKKTSDFIRQNSIVQNFTKNSWCILNPIEQSIKDKIEKIGVPLKDWDIKIYRGILTGCNEAFIIDGETKDALIAQDPKSAEIIRPILRGRDIKRYSYEFADKYVILAEFGSHKYLEEKYPAIYNHLLSYKTKLEQRGQCRYMANGKPNPKGEYPGQHHWLELDNNPRRHYLDDFSKQKIVWTPVNSEYRFTILPPDIYFNNSLFMITGEHIKYLCAVLNSNLFIFYLDLILGGQNYTYGSGNTFSSIPIKIPSDEEEILDKLVMRALEGEQSALSSINAYIYNIFQISDTERLYIENSSSVK